MPFEQIWSHLEHISTLEKQTLESLIRQLNENLFSFEVNCLFLGLRSVKTVFVELILLHRVMAHFKIKQRSFPSPQIRKGMPNLVKEDLLVCFFLVVGLGW